MLTSAPRTSICTPSLFSMDRRCASCTPKRFRASSLSSNLSLRTSSLPMWYWGPLGPGALVRRRRLPEDVDFEFAPPARRIVVDQKDLLPRFDQHFTFFKGKA